MDIHIYRLTKCGFYPRGKEESKFGSIEEWWGQFTEWVAEKEDVSLTATFDRPEEVPRRLYCADTASDGMGNFGVALWNESPMYRSNVAYLMSSGRVGEVEARTRRFPTGSIAGWPTYLWFLPRRSLVVALSPESFGGYRGSGVRQAREYFRSYLESHSSYVRYGIFKDGESESHEVIVGYSSPHEERIDRSIRPRFETMPLYAPGPLQEIVSRYKEIRKIVKSYTLTLPMGNNRSRIERLLDMILAEPVAENHHGELDDTDRRTFRVESTWRPSKGALMREIEEWETQDPADNHWVGVYFKGEDKIRRFDQVQGKASIELNGDLENRPLWTGVDLVQAWMAARDRVEDFLRSVENEQEVS